MGVRRETRDVPTFVVPRAEITVLERGLGVGRNEARLDRNGIMRGDDCRYPAQRLEQIVPQRKSAEVVRRRTSHGSDGQTACVRVAPGHVRGIGQIAGRAQIERVGPQIVGRTDDRLARLVERDAKVVRGEDGAVVAGRPMQVDAPHLDLGQLRAPVREPHAPSAKSLTVQAPAPAPAPVYEGEYIPPQPKTTERWKAAGGAAVGLGLIAAKFKTLLLVLLNLKWFAVGAKVFLSGFSFFASVWFYALFWGWKFALVFTLLILVHELGHAAVMRFYGVPASMPYFIPGFGALIQLKGRPASALEEAYVALGGPLVGTLGALACYLVGQATGNAFWTAAAYTGFFINLFNLAPALPLDGGRIVGAISPRIWIFGLVALVVAAVAFHWWNPLILILLVMSVPQAIAAWRGRAGDDAYHALSLPQRAGVALAYFGLAGFLFAAMLASRVAVPN